ncbi:MAG: redox-sensing transcriptional repressor Rex [Planctomycetota bacterium]|jgi:redox-sensing transcriptional repressor
MRYHKISDETVRRLPIYLRGLAILSEEGTENISSQKLAEYIGVNPWQIRKDFSYFGEFGKPGVGYNIKNLDKQIRKILKLNTGRKAALVGVGNLGSAVLAYTGFKIYGLVLEAAFDVDPKKIGRKINNVIIENISKISSLKQRRVNLGIITVPRDSAQDIADKLVKAGVTAILNFSPCYINVPKKVKVITIDIAMDLARLPYYMPAS